MTRLGIVQTAPRRDDQESMSHVADILRALGTKETDIVCLPEQWLDDNMIDDFEFTFAEFRRIAREFSMCIVPGAFYHRCRDCSGGIKSKDPAVHDSQIEPSKCGSTQKRDSTFSIVAPVISADGDIAGMQEKIHPFDYERDSVIPGSVVKVFESRGVRFGIMICYDTVFPSVASTLAKKGAQVILSPARIVKHGIAPWQLYVQVRALENRIPIMAANVSNSRFGGNSMAACLRFGDIATVDLGILKYDKFRSQYLTRDLNLNTYDKSRKKRHADENPLK